MKRQATKCCDLCKETVAVKSVLWRTVKDYVTIRGDEAPGYCNFEDNTTRVNWHFCYPCFFGIMKAASKAKKDGDNNA